MRKSIGWPEAAVLTVLFIAAMSTVQAQTVIDVDVNGTFTGTIATAGVDTVEGRFYATQGAAIQIKVQADRGSSLQPIVVVRNAAGQAVDGSTQRLRWLPVGNLIHYVTAPAAGRYTAEVGGMTGNGGFWARITGNSIAPPQMTTVSGTVTDAVTGEPIAGAALLVDGAAFATSGGDGSYSGTLAPGSYTLAVQAPGYQTITQAIAVGEVDIVVNVPLASLPVATLDTGLTGTPAFGGDVTATVDVQTQPGVTVTSYHWEQIYGTPVAIANGNTASPTVTLGDLADYKDELIHVISEPPIGEEDLPPNVPIPDEDFPGGLQDRLQVVALNPFSLEEAGLVVLEVTVTTTAGSFTEELEIHVSLPWVVTTGISNVPVGSPVLLYAPAQASYSWTVADEPFGSMAMLADATTQTPWFVPEVVGLYEIEVSDGGGGPVSTLEVYAGSWRGVIVDQDLDGRPVSDTACTFCHNDTLAADLFTPWAQTGHAEIFTNSLNTNSHYSSNCFACHTVGYDPARDNAGIDEADDYQDFLDAGLLSNPGDNWTTVLDQFPDTARLANIQCENCHGPQDSNAHGFAGPLGAPRASLSSDVCASCHGEPLRHARFQQWQLSGHANYELAVDEGDSGSCSRCHTANGFLAWLPVLLGEVPGDPLDDITVTWEPEDVHPQTCVTCHDPHRVGTSSGNDPDVNIRVSGDTPPLIAGFTATNVGRGAMCMTCHNSRRGLRNDSNFDVQSTSEKTRAPHPGVQADVVMGQNAYFVEVGTPGGHAMPQDTCVDCHMKATPPPDVLSYNQGGANHTFYAELTICSECHSPYLLASDVQNGIEQLLHQVEDLIEETYFDLMAEQVDAGNTIDVGGGGVITEMADVDEIQFSESRGRQALIVTLDGLVYGPTALTSINVLGPGGATLGSLATFADDDLLKAGWNYLLFHGDGSEGIHNPFFASRALIAARNALIALHSGGGFSPLRLQRGVLETPWDGLVPAPTYTPVPKTKLEKTRRR